jgi:hypothetical protein
VINHTSGGDQRGELNPWTLYLPDGGRVSGGVGVTTQIYDRNGNDLASSGLGRSITFQPGATLNEDYVAMQGAGNQELKWIIKWKNITVNKQHETTGAAGLQERGGTSTQTAQMECTG